MGNTHSIAGQGCFLTAVGNNPDSIAFKGDLLFGSRSPVYNLNFPVTPVVLAYPQTTEQVSEIVRCAVSHGYRVQARSGGHSYANYGWYTHHILRALLSSHQLFQDLEALMARSSLTSPNFNNSPWTPTPT